MKLAIFFSAILLFVITLTAAVAAEIPPLQYDGDTVYINTTQAYIAATPSSVSGIKPVIVEWTSKTYSGNINIIFGYNGEYLKPFKLERYTPTQICGVDNETNNCYWNNWTEVANSNLDFVKFNRNFNGKTDFYGFPNVNVNAGQNYKYRVWIEAPYLPYGQTQAEAYPDYDGKYDIAFYPSSWGTDIQGAYAANQLFVLDPEVNLTTGLVGYYSFDTDANDSTTNANHGTVSGATQGTTNCNFGGCYYFDGTNDKITIPDLVGFDESAAHSYSFWFRPDDVADEYDFVLARHNAGLQSSINFQLTDNAASNVIRYQTGSGAWDSLDNAGYSSATYYHIVVTWDGTTKSLYINNASALTSNPSAAADPADYNKEITLGVRNDNVGYFEGYIDELGIWDKALNSSEVSALYGGDKYPFLPVAESFTITASNLYNSSSLLTFNATVDGSSFSTTNGTIVTNLLQNDTNTHNITVIAEDYISRSYINLDVSSNLAAEITQAEIRFDCREYISNNSLTCDETKKFLNTGVYNITVNTTGYWSQIQEVNVTAQLNTTEYVYNFTNTQINISANNTVTNTYVTNYDLRVENTQYGFNRTYTPDAINYTINLTEGLNYTFYFTKNGFLPLSTTINNYTAKNVIINVTSVNINLQFYDEITEELITNTIFFELHYADGNASEGNTTTGSTTLELNNTGLLEIEYDSSLYDLRRYYLTITDTTTGNIPLYLLKVANSTEISYLITDENGVALENATLSVQRRYINNSVTTFKTVSMSRSDINGQGSLFLHKYTAIYRFVIQYGGATILITSPTEIEQNNIVLRGTVEESVTESIYKVAGIDWISGYDDYAFNLQWNDNQNIIDEVCFTLYKLRGTGKTTINSSCSSASVDSITFTIANTSTGDYLAVGIVDTNTNFSEYVVASVSKKLDNIKDTIGLQGVFFTAVMVVVAGTSAIFSVSAAVLLTIVGLAIGGIAGWLSIGYGTIIGIVVLGGFLLYSFRRGAG